MSFCVICSPTKIWHIYDNPKPIIKVTLQHHWVSIWQCARALWSRLGVMQRRKPEPFLRSPSHTTAVSRPPSPCSWWYPSRRRVPHKCRTRSSPRFCRSTGFRTAAGRIGRKMAADCRTRRSRWTRYCFFGSSCARSSCSTIRSKRRRGRRRLGLRRRRCTTPLTRTPRGNVL